MIESISNWFIQDYFTMNRRVVGLKHEILDAPIEQGKIKYIHLLPGHLKTGEDRLRNIDVECALIKESYALYALRIASFATIIFPLIGITFCLLNHLTVKPLDWSYNSVRCEWKDRFININQPGLGLYLSHLDVINFFIDSAVRTGCKPSAFEDDSVLISHNDLSQGTPCLNFYIDDYRTSADVSCWTRSAELTQPLAKRVHIMFLKQLRNSWEYPFELWEKSLKGSTLVVAHSPERNERLPKPLALYLKYLESKASTVDSKLD